MARSRTSPTRVRELAAQGLKVCPQCSRRDGHEVVKPLSALRDHAVHGKQPYCSACQSAAEVARNRPGGPSHERALARNRRWLAAHPQNSRRNTSAYRQRAPTPVASTDAPDASGAHRDDTADSR